MRTRDPFGMALHSLRTALSQGLAPGQHLPVGDVATALHLSTSPVREALSRLCGEGLIEDRRGLGYFTRAAPVEDILGLLDLEEVHVRLAARAAGQAAPPDASDKSVEQWMVTLMRDCGNQPLVESFERIHRRLAPLRRLEPVRTDGETSESDPIGDYYDRWRRASAPLAARVRRLDPTAPEYTTHIV